MKALLTALVLTAAVSAQDEFSFAVLGHLRGDPADGDTMRNPLLDEAIGRVATLDPDLVVLTGDSIWGDYFSIPARPEIVEQEWDVLDQALAVLPMPVHRVPGNHDISDLATRDIWNRRYGELPRTVSFGNALLLLMSTTWIPADGDTTQARHIKGVYFDRAQCEWIAEQLDANTSHEHVFVFVHHPHWWKQDAPWWRDVHPLLVGKNVRAVIGGDYGPTKYSHMAVDGIDYVNSCIASEPGLEMLLVNEQARMLSHQLDTFLLFTVRGSDVRFEAHTVGITQPKHAPARWSEVNEPPITDFIYYATLGAIGKRQKLAGLLLATGAAAGALGTLFLVAIVLRLRKRARRS